MKFVECKTPGCAGGEMFEKVPADWRDVKASKGKGRTHVGLCPVCVSRSTSAAKPVAKPASVKTSELLDLVDVARGRGAGYAVSWMGDRRSSDRIQAVAIFRVPGIGPWPMPPAEAAIKLRAALGLPAKRYLENQPHGSRGHDCRLQDMPAL